MKKIISILLLVKDGYLTNKKYGIIDSKGNTILPNEYDDISKKYGTYYYQTKKNNKYRLKGIAK